jgi:hypothetical protein
LEGRTYHSAATFVCAVIRTAVRILANHHSLGQLRAEATWVTHTLAYMTNKPWLE